MMVDPQTTAHRTQYMGRPYFFCSSGCQSKYGRAGDIRAARNRKEGGSRLRGHDLHVPESPPDPLGGAWFLSDLRDGARTRAGDHRDRSQSRTRRHDAPLLDRPCNSAARCGAGNGRPSDGSQAEAQRSRAPIQRLADQVSGYFVPAVIGVAVLAFAAWAIWGPEPQFSYGLVAAVAVLIIACPWRWGSLRRCQSWLASAVAPKPVC